MENDMEGKATGEGVNGTPLLVLTAEEAGDAYACHAFFNEERPDLVSGALYNLCAGNEKMRSVLVAVVSGLLLKGEWADPGRMQDAAGLIARLERDINGEGGDE